jgi:hypothetical protein
MVDVACLERGDLAHAADRWTAAKRNLLEPDAEPLRYFVVVGLAPCVAPRAKERRRIGHRCDVPLQERSNAAAQAVAVDVSDEPISPPRQAPAVPVRVAGLTLSHNSRVVERRIADRPACVRRQSDLVELARLRRISRFSRLAGTRPEILVVRPSMVTVQCSILTVPFISAGVARRPAASSCRLASRVRGGGLLLPILLMIGCSERGDRRGAWKGRGPCRRCGRPAGFRNGSSDRRSAGRRAAALRLRPRSASAELFRPGRA